MKQIFIWSWCLLISTLSLGQNTQQANTEVLPHINFSFTEHDFGKIEVNADASCEFKFTNTGKVPLILSNVRASCGCTVPEWTKEPILPGDEGVIKVKYTTVTRPNVINKSIMVYSNADNKQVILRIKGEVVPKG